MGEKKALVNSLCPFCGNKGAIDTLNYTSGKPGKFRAQCQDCLAATHWCDTEGEAWEAWNKRNGQIQNAKDCGEGEGMKTPEREVVKVCLEYLELRGVRAYRQNTGAAEYRDKTGKRRFVRYGKPGISDIIGILPGGRFIAVECKAPGGNGFFLFMKKRGREKRKRSGGFSRPRRIKRPGFSDRRKSACSRYVWGHSSDGRAPVLQAGCRRFDAGWFQKGRNGNLGVSAVGLNKPVACYATQ